VSVVNIDNGFGAGALAGRILATRDRAEAGAPEVPDAPGNGARP
jgi:hypothetical protein